MNTDDINSWAHFNSWQCVLPPSRPTDWQLKIIREGIKKVSQDKAVAVLGSTIEYRDLLSELGFYNVFVFERNVDFYRYITPYAKHSLNEILVEGNWLNTLQVYKNTFCIILSDLTSGNISYDLRDTFYQNIRDSLTGDGLFFDRILTNAIPYHNIDDLIRKYSNMHISNSTVNSFNCEVLFCSTLLEKEKIVDSSKFYDYLLSLNIPQISAFVHACYYITPRDCIWWYGNPWPYEGMMSHRIANITDELL